MSRLRMLAWKMFGSGGWFVSLATRDIAKNILEGRDQSFVHLVISKSQRVCNAMFHLLVMVTKGERGVILRV